MACKVDNNAYEIEITPSRKRKRNSDRCDVATSPAPPPPAPIPSGLINAAFSSTPKKEAKYLIDSFNRFSRKINGNKENAPFTGNSCLEVKSIADIANTKKIEAENQYEVVRKPPKKKKKADIEEACFVNPALNLEVPEKQFNPFEVRRSPPVTEFKGFSNPGLNIRTQGAVTVLNPYEITRLKATPTVECTKDGISNPAMETHSGLSIGIPFTPRVGCRIDFQNFPLENLTPSKLLADKLIFSPVNPVPKNPKAQSLSVISEEAIDIDKELDCYQLELENSINEAKVRKNGGARLSFGMRLEEIEESVMEEITPDVKLLLEAEKLPKTPIPVEVVQIETVNPSEQAQVVEKMDKVTEEEEIRSADASFFDDEDDEIDFKAPAPFVRAYRKAETISAHSSKESIPSSGNKSKEIHSETKTVTNMIRKSIRKLMPSNFSSKKHEEEEKKPIDTANGLFGSIRHSLRRRPNKSSKAAADVEKEPLDIREISILDCAERTKFKSCLISTDYIKIEDVTAEKKYSLRNSIRNSTRGVKNHVLKSVFNKNVEEYQFRK